MRIKHIAIAIALLLCGLQVNAQLNKTYFYNQGVKNIQRGNYIEALKTLNTLIAADSTFADAWFLRGVTKYNLDDLNGAYQDFCKAININPIHTSAYHYRAIVSGQMGKTGTALNDITIASGLRPNDNEIIFTRGVTNLHVGKYQQAIEDFTLVLAQTPDNRGSYINRSIAKTMVGDTLSALSDLNKAVQINPFDADGYNRRGRLYFEMGSYNLALDDLDKALELSPKHTLSLFTRSLIYSEQQQFTKSLIDLNKVIEQNPTNALALYNRALIYTRIDSLTQALDDYNRIALLNPENLLVFYNRAAVYYDLGNFQAAIADYTVAIELFPDFPNAYYNRASAKNQIGDANGAQKDFNTARQKQETYAQLGKPDFLKSAKDSSRVFDKLLRFDSDFNKAQSDKRTKIKVQGFFPLAKYHLQPVDTKTEPSNNPINQQLKGYQVALLVSAPSANSINVDSILKSDASEYARWLVLGIVQSNHRHYSQSIAAFENAVIIEPTNITALLALATAKAEMAKYIQSFQLEPINTTLTINSSVSRQPNEKAVVEYHAYDEALALLTNLEAQHPTLPEIPYNKGMILLLADKQQEAINELTKSVTIMPSFSQAWYNRGLTYLLLNNKEQACQDFSKAGELGLFEAFTTIKEHCGR